MIIRAFHIKNYRSIVDSGVCFLSRDNITALIGQNESGKTSVLEALRSFYEDRITDDVLRSDQTFPEITCIMALNEMPLNQLIDFARIPAELHDILREKQEISLTRKWINARKSTFSIVEPEILKFFETLCQKRKENDSQIRVALPLLEKQLDMQDYRRSVPGLSHKVKECRNYIRAASDIGQLENEIESKAEFIHETERLYEFCSSAKEARNISRRLEQLKAGYNQLSALLKAQEDRLFLLAKTTCKILNDQDQETAMHEAETELNQERNYYSAEDIGKQLFSGLPVFEFFEDFSSLLPNKIDLEDLLTENRHAEGYKAARNFLSVAGLNADFFREKNHRILKQKIENLNTDITVDFQDYWRQQVGKNDKIRLNFELEHYDFTVPEKSGKPYLEFWIKDKQERLYPKQRSRGVRWFLSFYLELKATAKEAQQNRILLIDEPGLSLHARAQEDVLKVFEDLKDSLQIIYCTHSPHLIDLHKLYRIMAVQRIKEGDETSATVVLDARSMNMASSDTLSPVYSLMGTKLNDKQFIYQKNNIIVSDIIIFYYLDTMARILGMNGKAHFIPASGTDGIPVMANLLFGWKIDFGLLFFDRKEDKAAGENLRKTIFAHNEAAYLQKVRELSGFRGIEDMFSTIDFKRYILNQRIGITENNSDFIEFNNLSPIILVSDFCSLAEKENLKESDFDEQTLDNFKRVFNLIHEMVA